MSQFSARWPERRGYSCPYRYLWVLVGSRNNCALLSSASCCSMLWQDPARLVLGRALLESWNYLRLFTINLPPCENWGSTQGLLYGRHPASLSWVCSTVCDVGETGNNSSVVRELAQKASKFVFILWDWIFSHSFQFLRVARYPLLLRQYPRSTLHLSVKYDTFPGWVSGGLLVTARTRSVNWRGALGMYGQL
jgi:hypothetical protein